MFPGFMRGWKHSSPPNWSCERNAMSAFQLWLAERCTLWYPSGIAELSVFNWCVVSSTVEWNSKPGPITMSASRDYHWCNFSGERPVQLQMTQDVINGRKPHHWVRNQHILLNEPSFMLPHLTKFIAWGWWNAAEENVLQDRRNIH